MSRPPKGETTTVFLFKLVIKFTMQWWKPAFQQHPAELSMDKTMWTSPVTDLIHSSALFAQQWVELGDINLPSAYYVPSNIQVSVIWKWPLQGGPVRHKAQEMKALLSLVPCTMWRCLCCRAWNSALGSGYTGIIRVKLGLGLGTIPWKIFDRYLSEGQEQDFVQNISVQTINSGKL